MSHREYAGGGATVAVMRCRACGATVRGGARNDADAAAERARAGRSRRHRPVDDGPPSNPVLDPEVARRLLQDLGG